MPKNDYGAGHWSSDKVWNRKKDRRMTAKEFDVTDRILQVLNETELNKTEKVVVLTGAIRRLIGLE